MADTNIAAGPIEVVISIKSLLHYHPPAPIDVQKNTTFSVDPLEVTIDVLGEMLNVMLGDGLIEVTTLILGEFVESVTISAGSIDVVVTLQSTGYVIGSTCNVVKWSKVGALDFTVDRSNISNERPLDWKGCIYNILKLVDRVVAYGENGVSLLKPSGVHYGLQTIHRIGIANKNAVIGNEFVHFFVDKADRFYMLTVEGPKRLDYSEYLSVMTSPVLSMDDEKKLIYICDGTYGFVYSMEDNSLGEGPVDITGFGIRDDITHVVSSGTAVTPKFEMLTDVYDMNSRKSKTIYSIEVGTDLTEFLQAKIEFKTENNREWQDGDWKPVNRDGFAYIRCFGVEFRFRLRSSIYEYFEIDYIKVNGTLHDKSSLDSYSLRG